MISSIIAVISNSFETLASRSILESGRYRSEKFVAMMFMGIVVLMIPLIFLFSDINVIGFDYLMGGVFVGLVAVAAIYNILYFKAIKRMKVENAQPIILSSWIFTIVFGFLFVPSERDIVTFLLACIASLTVIIVELNGGEFKMGKYERMMLVAAAFIGLYNLLSRIMLSVMDPFSLYWIRTIFLFPLFLYISEFKARNTKKYFRAWIVAAASIVSQVSVFWSYSAVGLVMTSLIMNFVPILTLFGAHFYLGEKIQFRNIIATFVIIFCVVLSVIV